MNPSFMPELNPNPVFLGELYAVYQLVNPVPADNLQVLWNYAVVSLKTGVREVYTDSYPGALSMLVRLTKGTQEMETLISEEKAAKEKELSQQTIRAAARDKYQH